MKNIKKYVALILAVAFIAILPLTAFADTPTGVLPGTWVVSASYDTDTGDYESITAGSSVSKIIFNANGSASYYIGPDAFSASWQYKETDETGYWYLLTVNYNGSSLPLTMLYTEGQIYLLVSTTIYIYSK